MAWEQQLFALLDDLEQQASTLYAAERSLDLVDRRRAEYRTVTLAARLMASVDAGTVLEVSGAGPVAGRLERVAQGWCLVRGTARDWIVVVDAIITVRGASARAVPEVAWPATARLGLGSALRGLADSGLPAVVHTRDGARFDGLVGRVGADFVELLIGDPARDVLLAFTAIAAVSSSD